MPSGKRAKQQRRAASGRPTPPPVRSHGGSRRPFNVSRRTLVIVAVVVLVALGLGVGLPLGLSSSSGGGSTNTSSTKNLLPAPPVGPPGPEGPPLEKGPNLAPTGSPSPGQSVDGIQCGAGEQLAFHIHSRLTLFVDGHSERVPYGVGIADPHLQPGPGVPFVGGGACFSWLHTHAADGVIHIESPVQRTFTVGNFFDVWGQPLSSTQVGPARGPVTAFLDGKKWTRDPRDIPLGAHAQIQLEVGRPLVAPVHITGWGGL
jgi:hypothetical protein